MEQILREDGPEHYREHMLDLRSWWRDGDGDDEDGDDEVADERTGGTDDPVSRLGAARSSFLAALEALPAASWTQPIVEQWDARDLVEHVAFWSEHGAGALELALAGRGAEFDYDTDQTDAMNAAEAGRRRGGSMVAAREREAAGYERLRAAMARAAQRCAERLGNGDAVGEVMAYDGWDHYAEHAAHLRGA